MPIDLFFKFEPVGYFIEVLIAELLFFHSTPRKKNFILRLLFSVAISVVIVSNMSFSTGNNTLSRFILLFSILAISFVCMYFSFEADVFNVSSSCIAGIATQHIANKTITLFMLIPSVNSFFDSSIIHRITIEIFVSFIVYLIIYLVFARSFLLNAATVNSTLVSVAIVITCIGTNRLVADHEEASVYYKAAACIYAVMCCVFALSIQFYLHKWQQEKAEYLVIKQLLSASEKQYEQWKTMIQINNIHIHDLKHLLDKIEKLSGKEKMELPDLSSVRESIENFSPLVKTGNEVIDVLLRNMDTLCHEQNIQFNCISYTEELSKFDSMSLYFLFANAIDNAREGASTVSDPAKRLIDVSLKQFGDSVIIHIWNYFDGELVMEDGLPVSSKPQEGHGYGLKSIKLLVDKFEGAMKAQPEGDVFHLNIILPLKTEK